VLGVLAAGGALSTLLGTLLGVWAEAATLVLAGAALYGSGLMLGGSGGTKVSTPEGVARQV
jgi:hypothetical protein